MPTNQLIIDNQEFQLDKNNETIFDFNGQSITIKLIDNKEYFLAKSICNALELNNVSQALSNIDEKDIILNDTLTNGGIQKLSYVNEAGLYALIFQSRKKEAKEFKRWVFNEVLPQIRKTGKFETQITLPKTYKEALIELVAKIDTIEKLEIENLKQQNKIEIQDNTIYEISNTQDSYSLRECKNRLMCEENKLKNFLKHKKWIQYLSDGIEGKKMYSTSYSKSNGFANDKAVLNKARQTYYHQFRITKAGMNYLIKHREDILNLDN